ncbi:MAG: hypothetical protein WAW37_03160 [Syntrophobacteraceae bacterium]
MIATTADAMIERVNLMQVPFPFESDHRIAVLGKIRGTSRKLGIAMKLSDDILCNREVSVNRAEAT